MRTVFWQLLKFMRLYNKYWLAPILFGMIILGGLLVTAQSSAISAYFYAIF